MIHLYWNFRALLACALALGAIIVFSVTIPAFLNPGNLYALLQAFAVLALVATGLALTMIAGEFDLSIAGTLPMAALLAVKVGESAGIAVGLTVAVVAAAAVGALNGWLTARFNIPSLAVTVGTMVLTIGVGFAIAGGNIVTLSDFSFGFWLDNPVAGIFSPRTIIQLLLVAAVGVLMVRSWSGKAVYAVGSDRDRARSTGMPVLGSMVLVFVISGLFAGAAGAMQGLTLGSGAPGSADPFLLQAVTAAIIGGVALTGGKGSVYGVAAGALLLAVVSNGLSLQGTPTAVIQLVNGGILLLVVVVDKPLNRLVNRSLENVIAQRRTPAASMAQ